MGKKRRSARNSKSSSFSVSDGKTEKKKKKSKTKKSTDRANAEKVRRQHVRQRVLDLRDLLPQLKAGIGDQFRLKTQELNRDMNMTQTLNCTVEFLEDLVKDIEKK